MGWFTFPCNSWGTKSIIFEFSKLDLSSYFAISLDPLDQDLKFKALEKSGH